LEVCGRCRAGCEASPPLLSHLLLLDGQLGIHGVELPAHLLQALYVVCDLLIPLMQRLLHGSKGERGRDQRGRTRLEIGEARKRKREKEREREREGKSGRNERAGEE
jgi:hypothetical protein